MDCYVISVHHTRRDSRYIILWKPDDTGYTYRTTNAGRYAAERVRAHLDYYNSGCANIAVPCSFADGLTGMTLPADQLDGPEGPAIRNTAENWRALIAKAIVRPAWIPEPEYPGAPREKLPHTRHTHAEYLNFDLFGGDESDLACRTVRLARVRQAQECFLGKAPGQTPHMILRGRLARIESALVDGSFFGRYHCCIACMDREIEAVLHDEVTE